MRKVRKKLIRANSVGKVWHKHSGTPLFPQHQAFIVIVKHTATYQRVRRGKKDKT